MSQMAILSPVASVIFALLIACVCLFLVVKNWLSDQPALQRARKRHSESEFRASSLESVLSAYPGVVMLWSGLEKVKDGRWTAPRLTGSPATMAALQTALDIGQGVDFSDAILEGFSQLSARFMRGVSRMVRRFYGLMINR